MYEQQHSRPHISIPSGARPPTNPSPSAYAPYAFELTAPRGEPEPYLANPWDGINLPNPYMAPGERPRTQSMQNIRQRSSSPGRASTVANSGYAAAPMHFPEPQVLRSSSQRASPNPGYTPLLPHRYSRSDVGTPPPAPAPVRLQREESSLSLASSYYPEDYSDPYASGSADSHGDDTISREFSEMSLESEGIYQFQAGKLSDAEEAWHRLVPAEARDALGKTEVQRQSVMFEVFKSERDYVADLEAVLDVYVTGLQNASPPIIAVNMLPGFISEVFGNLQQILAHHQRLLGALFNRQREQHPFVITISDIVLDTTLKSDFRSSYETYVKHYPIAESHHRKELRRNQAYRTFIQSVSSDHRIKKRDLITFLSRPVTRLPRFNLLLEQILKLTDKETDHPDLESLPVSLDILKACIKSTQPGIEAAEGKVKFWALCEGLIYQKGEIIDMDLYDDSRTLLYAGPVARKSKSSTSGTSWNDLSLALLDNFLLLTREETKQSGVVKRYLMSRPMPLSFLRLGSFEAPPEYRKVPDREGSILGGLRYHNVTVYPFTIYHASNKANRRYTLFVLSEALRKKWHSALVDAIGVHKVRQEGNMFFDPRTITDGFFRTTGSRITTTQSHHTGKITTAVPFVSNGRPYVAVGCAEGIYVSMRGHEDYKKVLNVANPTTLAAIQSHKNKIFNKFVVHHDSSLVSFSLDLIARVSQGQAEPKLLNASLEKIAGQPNSVVFFRYTHVGSRVLIIYSSKKLFQVSLNLQVLEVVDISESAMSPSRGFKKAIQPSSFRQFGEPGYVPKDAYDVTTLVKTIGICTSDGIVIVDPTNIARSATTLVPDLAGSSSNMPMNTLKSKVEGAKPLGLVRVETDELLVVYDTIGFYINRHGIPGRSCGYIKWESRATSHASRGDHLLLFSDGFVEIRQVKTGRLVQVIEGEAIRLLYAGPTVNSDDPILVALKGTKDDRAGVSERIVELVETSEINTAQASTPTPALWEEWDM